MNDIDREAKRWKRFFANFKHNMRKACERERQAFINTQYMWVVHPKEYEKIKEWASHERS